MCLQNKKSKFFGSSGKCAAGQKQKNKNPKKLAAAVADDRLTKNYK
jgi:hypothetical protein